jgi:hypothetical protein
MMVAFPGRPPGLAGYDSRRGIEAGAPSPAILISQHCVRRDGFRVATFPVSATSPAGGYTEFFPIVFAVRDSTSGELRRVEMRFLGPCDVPSQLVGG